MQDTKTISGSILHITDAANTDARSITVDISATQDLNGYDKPWSGGVGKNKFDPSRCYKAINGIVFSETSDKKIKIAGTATAAAYSGGNASNYSDTWVKLKAGTYTVSVSGLSSTQRFYVGGYDVNGNAVSVYPAVGGDGVKTVTVAQDFGIWYWLNVPNGETANNTVSIQIEQGSSATSWEPYENFCPISGTDSVGVSVSGVNVWDEEWEQGTYSTTNGGKIGTSSYWRNKNPISVKPSETYYFHTSGDYLYRFFYDKNKQFVGYLAGISDASYQIPANVYYLNIVDVTRNTYDPSEKPVSINYPSTDHDYHAYNGHTTTTALPQTVYGARAEIVGGQMTVTHITATYDGVNKKFNSYSDLGNGKALMRNTVLSPVGKNTPSSLPVTELYANEFNALQRAEIGNCYVTANGSVLAVVVSSTEYTSVADFNTWLASNPLQVVYELATPQTVTLSAAAVELLKECYVWSSAGDITLVYETYLINGIFHKVKVNGISILGPNDFTLERSDVYAAEITTCTGKTIADRIGWKYADMDLNWDYLPQDQLEILLNLSGVFSLTFENEEGDQFTEQCIKRNSVMTGTRFTADDGTAVWKNVQFGISFINVH